jgi:hypothetical protein
MSRSSRNSRSRHSRALVVSLAGAAVIVSLYVLAVFFTVSSPGDVAKRGSSLDGTTVLIRGLVTSSYALPLTKLGAYVMGDADASILVITSKGAPPTGERWVVDGVVRTAIDGKGIAKALTDLGSGATIPDGAVGSIVDRIAKFQFGTYVTESRRHQWLFLPWV